MAEKKRYSIVEFEDGLQLIPNNWFHEDRSKAYWPYFTSNMRYEKAVQRMEEPELTWSKYPIVKILASFCKEYYILFLYFCYNFFDVRV